MIDKVLLEGTFEDLEKLRNQLAKRANARLRRLKKSGISNWAYKMAERYNRQKYGTLRYITSHKEQTKASVRQDIREIEKFLNSPTSTLKGRKQLEEKIVDSLSKDVYENGYLVRKGFNITDSRGLFDFFDSEIYRWLEESATITSEELIDIYTQSVNEGKTQSEIYDALERFQSGAVDTIDELYEEMGLDFFA